MAEKRELIVKQYDLTKEAKLDLSEINIAIAVSERQLAGMRVNRDYVLEKEYQRCGIKIDGPKGYKRHITYNTETAKITVSDLLIPKGKKDKNKLN